MILEDLTVGELGDLLGPHMKKPAWPGVADPAVKRRARRLIWPRTRSTPVVRS